jgi:hypothetical protein
VDDLLLVILVAHGDEVNPSTLPVRTIMLTTILSLR